MKFTAAHWGTYKVSKDEGGGFKLLPFSKDKDPSDIGRGIESAIRHSSRIQKPAVRKGWLEYQNSHKNQLPVKNQRFVKFILGFSPNKRDSWAHGHLQD